MNIVEENRTRELDERKTTVTADGEKKGYHWKSVLTEAKLETPMSMEIMNNQK